MQKAILTQNDLTNEEAESLAFLADLEMACINRNYAMIAALKDQLPSKDEND